MKNKKYLFLAASAALFAACSSNDDANVAVNEQAPAQQEVGFGAYLNRSTTRAGATGTLTLDGTSSTTSLQTNGFGVFGYYTDNKLYGETSIPDFMYNQKVTGDGSNWNYSPIKYWPNEFGLEAISEGQDRLTFFAYAPYVEVTPNTGIVTDGSTTGIVALTRNTATGDPYVKYYADMDPDNRVDLCWGVAKEALSSSVDGTNNSISIGKPFIDVMKPKTGDKIYFDFKHALAALNVTIDADVDVESHNNGELDGLTRIWVRSVTFNGFTTKGMLNLNGEATAADYVPNWYDLSGNTKIGSGSVTIFDGRRDGKEGQSNAAVSNEKPNDLNVVLIQSAAYDKDELNAGTPKLQLVTSGITGVQHTAVNLFNSTDATAPIYVIPTDEDLEVTIVYDVETADKNLSTYLSDGVTKGSTIENKITKTIKISDSAFKLSAGKKYTIGLHLGMTSVKFNAFVTDWEDKTADNTDLPINKN